MINAVTKGESYMFNGQIVTVVTEPRVALRYRIEATGQVKIEATGFFLWVAKPRSR